jgi:hypothetical protein
MLCFARQFEEENPTHDGGGREEVWEALGSFGCFLF